MQMCRLRDFESLDKFYLLSWARDLRHYFPFLTLDEDAYAYELYYQVWRLSHLFGQMYADLSVAFEDLITNPRSVIRAILNAAAMADVDVEMLVPLITQVSPGKWREHGDAAWFTDLETRVDRILSAYVDGISNTITRASPWALANSCVAHNMTTRSLDAAHQEGLGD